MHCFGCSRIDTVGQSWQTIALSRGNFVLQEGKTLESIVQSFGGIYIRTATVSPRSRNNAVLRSKQCLREYVYLRSSRG